MWVFPGITLMFVRVSLDLEALRRLFWIERDLNNLWTVIHRDGPRRLGTVGFRALEGAYFVRIRTLETVFLRASRLDGGGVEFFIGFKGFTSHLWRWRGALVP